MNRGFAYLASPYSIHPRGLDVAAKEAAEVAAWLLKYDIRVFSPVVHFHPIEKNYGKFTHKKALSLELPYLKAADALIIAPLCDWTRSKGIRFELEAFEEYNKMPGIVIANLEERDKEPLFDIFFSKEVSWKDFALEPIPLHAIS